MEEKDPPKIPKSASVIFLADYFVENLTCGGAELTTEALIETSPFEVYKLLCQDLTEQIIENNQDKFWILGNFAQLSDEQIISLTNKLNYSILEYDYKYCQARSPELCAVNSERPCRCSKSSHGQLIMDFYSRATTIWWMSERQMKHYHSLSPEIKKTKNIVLSSVFSSDTLDNIRRLRSSYQSASREKWLVLGSPSWIKGQSEGETWCKTNNLPYEVVWDLPYNELLEKLAQAAGLVFLPLGGDTCPRLVIEAKLLGCQLVTNHNVQHADESWFDTENLEQIENHLRFAPFKFWFTISQDIDNAISPVKSVRAPIQYKTAESLAGPPKISVIIPCYNYAHHLPFAVLSVINQSFQQFEIIIVNDGSTDNTAQVATQLIADNREHSITVINQQNSGQPAIARNNGIRVARGEYIICLDADDMIHPLMLEMCINALDSNPSAAIAFTDAIFFRDETDGYRMDSGQFDLARLATANQVFCCALFRKTLWEQVGRYKENCKGYEDWDFWISCAETGACAVKINEPLFFYRESDSGLFKDALKRDEQLKAAIVSNHPDLYDEKTKLWALEVLSRDLNPGKSSPQPPQITQ